MSVTHVERTLTQLAGMLERFVARWEATDDGDGPPLVENLPADPQIRRLALIELIKIDLEYRWVQRNNPRRLEEYFAQFPELLDGGIPTDLLYEEFYARRQSGLNVDPEEYRGRFPDQAKALAHFLGMAETRSSTSISRALAGRSLTELDVGDRIDDFDLLARLGKGAFAQVYLARQRSMQRLVALKVSADQGLEPQTLAQLDHDHIVRVYDVRTLPDRQLRLLYMQYLPGGTLHQVIERLRGTSEELRSGTVLWTTVKRSLDDRGESPPIDSPLVERLSAMTWSEMVCWIGARLARALAYASRQGVLHRDVKPANVLLAADGTPKLADFNISFGDKVVGATPEAFFGGSLAYMSPEQLEAFHPTHSRQPGSLDGRSDLYSLGVMLWEMLTGQRPFPDEGHAGHWNRTLDLMIERRRRGITADELHQLPWDCPAGLARVLSLCLSPDPADRWENGDVLARQLEICAKPGARELLSPPESSWRVRMRPWALSAILTVALIPNALGGAFNYFYNWNAIVTRNPRFQDVFVRVATEINLVAYTVGVAIVAVLVGSALRGRDQILSGQASPEDAARWRRLCLFFGHWTAIIGVIDWGLCGFAYPIDLHLRAGVPPPYLHFFVSFVLCGLIASAYPYFFVTFLAVRCVYPELRPAEQIPELGIADCERLARLNYRYLLTAGAVPLLTIGTLAVAMLFEESPNREQMTALSILGIVGFGGLLAIYPLFRAIQSDAQTLHDLFSDAPATRRTA